MPFIKISLTVETPPFGAVEFGFVWEGRNPFQIRATHRAAPYVRPCVLKHLVSSVFSCRAAF
ncbi:MAG: hypothetical protein D8H97_21525 [Neisseria sp.]|nr:MAG: hypothetical protein D8H97_21525 [Neisseria sp.]